MEHSEVQPIALRDGFWNGHHVPFLSPGTVVGHLRELFGWYVGRLGATILRVLVFVKYHGSGHFGLCKRPWSPRGSRRYAPMGADGWVCSLAYAVHQMLSLLPCVVTANGAAGHNPGEVAETPPLARTQGRTFGCILDFNFFGPFFFRCNGEGCVGPSLCVF